MSGGIQEDASSPSAGLGEARQAARGITWVRTGIGAVLSLTGLVAMGTVVWSVGDGDYVSAGLGALAGLGLCGAGVELLRPVVGE